MTADTPEIVAAHAAWQAAVAHKAAAALAEHDACDRLVAALQARFSANLAALPPDTSSVSLEQLTELGMPCVDCAAVPGLGDGRHEIVVEAASSSRTPAADGGGELMSDILSRIDSTLDGLCPCGAEPAPGSPYCSYDCTPTHIGPDTDTTWNGLPADLDGERALAVRRIAEMFDVPPALLLAPDAAPAPARGMPLTEAERQCLEQLSDGEETFLWVEPADGLRPRRVHARRRSSRRGSIIDLRLVDDPRPELTQEQQ